jgi:hypothetical protein
VIEVGEQTRVTELTVTVAGLTVMVTVPVLLESPVDVAVMITVVAAEIADDAVNVTAVPEGTFAEALNVPAFVGLTERFDVLT